ncbi:hypothetical protein C2R22_24530 (plasmid) [Salinigranum rubrum]|uniref:Uncharacterized protein n=1 Tax=Salinigranum rubrum TaxID=755307 RepID=A0A2I8VRZ6_9EURY|nr:hypothetical protein [Salinigranum rubrum]AUV84698.1 hypothetical protein C2R22_24530 [Salinigranum rubrum]
MTYRLLAALVLLVATLSPVASVARADDVVTVDASHSLTDQDTIDDYERTGVASTSVDAPALKLTVAESHDDVGLDGFHLDMDSRYLRVEYNESIPRTVRFYVPSEYWYPVTYEGREAENSDVTADMRPTADGRYTAVTVRLTGKTDAVFEVPAAASFIFWGRGKAKESVANTTGYEPPEIGATATEWRYIPDGQLENSSYPINVTDEATPTIQYDAEPAQGEQRWLAVPQCGNSDTAPVCTYEKQGIDDKMYVLSRSADAPPVRFQSGTDYASTGRSVWSELETIPSRFFEDINGLFGGAS